MKKTLRVFRIGTRTSKLARLQTREALEHLTRLLPILRFREVPITTPGDRDLATDLRISPANFFTRDLDEAILAGSLDAAVHSAKDLPEPVSAGLDWCWLPWREDPRDVLVLRPGISLENLPKHPTIGVSSARREEYAHRRFPAARLKPVRGALQERIRQLDSGDFDILLMAAAGLSRLGLENRISEWIDLDALPSPAGQGALAITFRAGDKTWLRIRSLLVPSVVIAGAGGGTWETCTLGAWEALEHCDTCFHDSLVDSSLLDHLPRHAQRVNVGKRCGRHHVPQTEINTLITVAARRSLRVVRLKGGDPGIFGRLAEEIEALDALHLPYYVIPGVSSLNLATTGTGMLLTRRNALHGFTAMTARRQDNKIGALGASSRAALPIVFFMGIGVLDKVIEQLRTDGLPETTPIAVALDAGTLEEKVVRGCLADIEQKMAGITAKRPGLIIVGEPAQQGYRMEWGALMGRRVLLPSSEALQKKAAALLRDFGGVPVSLPLIRIVPNPACVPVLKSLEKFDWLVVTSPSSVHVLIQMLRQANVDVRSLPKILVTGPGTAEAFKTHGIVADAMPQDDYCAEGIIKTVKKSTERGATVLRLRSELAGPRLSERMRKIGLRVTDSILYTNEQIHPKHIPPFDAVFFASASAVDAFFATQHAGALEGKPVVAIGSPTRKALKRHGISAVRMPPEATVHSAIQILAAGMVQKELARLSS